MTARDPINPSDSGRPAWGGGRRLELRGTHRGARGETTDEGSRRGDGARPSRPLHVHHVADLAAVRQAQRRRRHLQARTGLRAQGHPLPHTAAEGFDLERQVVVTADGEVPYDRSSLQPALAWRSRRSRVSGPKSGYTESVCNLGHATHAGEAWQRFLANPGPVVIGTAQGGSCFGASYEFLLNTRHQLKKAGLAGKVPITFVSSEPFLGHFGLGGVGDSEKRVTKFFDRLGIRGIANASIDEVRPGEIRLAGGEVLPFAFSMIVPPFTGVDAVTRPDGLGNSRRLHPRERRVPSHRPSGCVRSRRRHRDHPA